jgi:hypothetical protein
MPCFHWKFHSDGNIVQEKSLALLLLMKGQIQQKAGVRATPSLSLDLAGLQQEQRKNEGRNYIDSESQHPALGLAGILRE